MLGKIERDKGVVPKRFGLQVPDISSSPGKVKMKKVDNCAVSLSTAFAQRSS